VEVFDTLKQFVDEKDISPLLLNAREKLQRDEEAKKSSKCDGFFSANIVSLEALCIFSFIFQREERRKKNDARRKVMAEHLPHLNLLEEGL
jgi:hypothetical protein